MFGVLYGLVPSETFLFLIGLLEIGCKIVTDLVNLDGGPFLSQLKAELLWIQLFPCLAKAREAQKQHILVCYGNQASFFN